MSYSPTNGINTNAIADNQYYDIVNGNTPTALYFNAQWGFDINVFDADHPNLIVNVSDAAGFLAALTTVESNGGGTINLAAGTYVFTNQMNFPSNVIIQGASKNTTILQFNKPDTDGIKIKHKKNVVFRDVTFDGLNIGRTGVSVWYAKNVLFERIIFTRWGNASSNAGSGITFRYTSFGTIRFIQSNGQQFHGISNKDHFCSSCTTVDDLIARYISDADTLDAGLPLNGVPFTEKCIVHSNVCNDSVDEYGIDWHGQLTEIAGNLFSNNHDGCKFPDSQNLFIHNNIFESAGIWNLYFYDTYPVSDRDIQDVCVFDNIIRDSVQYGIRAQHNAQIHITDNTWENNPTPIYIGSGGADLSTCAGSFEATNYSANIVIDNGECTFCNVASVTEENGEAEFTIQNSGPDTATNVTITINSGGASLSNVTATSGIVNFNASIATITVASIANGSSVTVNVFFEAVPGTYNLTASVSASQFDSNTVNNTVIVPVTTV